MSRRATYWVHKWDYGLLWALMGVGFFAFCIFALPEDKFWITGLILFALWFITCAIMSFHIHDGYGTSDIKDLKWRKEQAACERARRLAPHRSSRKLRRKKAGAFGQFSVGAIQDGQQIRLILVESYYHGNPFSWLKSISSLRVDSRYGLDDRDSILAEHKRLSELAVKLEDEAYAKALDSKRIMGLLNGLTTELNGENASDELRECGECGQKKSMNVDDYICADCRANERKGKVKWGSR